MGIPLNGFLDVRWPSLLDGRSGKRSGSSVVPYDSVAQALNAETGVPMSRRAEGLILFVKNNEDIESWQFIGGISNEQLVIVFTTKYPVTGPNSGTVTSPTGTITLQPGMYRELVLEVSGETESLASIGLTEGGSEIADNITVQPSIPFVVSLSTRFKMTATIYITSQNNLIYEIYKA